MLGPYSGSGGGAALGAGCAYAAVASIKEAAAAITVIDNERMYFLPTVVFVSNALVLGPPPTQDDARTNTRETMGLRL